jgi:hypothetical protein
MDQVRWDFRGALGGLDVRPGASVTRDVELSRAPPLDSERR